MTRDVDFLFEVGALRFQPRQWQRFLMRDAANITEHHYRVIWLALIIAGRDKTPVDTDKLIKLALVHDLAESRSGDVDYLSRQYVNRDETKAIGDIFANTTLEAEFKNVWQEYEERSTIEAKIVKDADHLDVDLELREQEARGATVAAEWQAHRQELAKNTFFTAAAQALYDEILAANPHNWHTTSPSNRVNGGDWKEQGKV